MKKLTLSFIFFFCLTILLKAQQPVTIKCATDELTKELYKKYPERKNKAAQIEAAVYEQVKNITATRGGNCRGPVRIVPVVVHIVHNNGPENITNIQVLQGIQHLNDAFRNVGSMQDPNGVDTEIEFCLAQRDPNGNATNGITRTVNALTSMVMENDDVALKNLIRWNSTLYLNIWLVSDITSIATGPGVSGYATMSSSHGLNDDGIVNEAFFFGSNATNSKVHIHEAGHYLGLFHTFEGGCPNNNCLVDGDKICDTPPDNSTANITCGTTINTCTTDDDDLSANNPFRPIGNGGIGDQNDLVEDHMDYGDVACHTLFTLGQKNRMQAVVTGPRASLLQSIACTSPCTNPIVISFTPNTTTTINLGGTVNFTNTTTGATNYNWTIGGTSFGTGTNASNTFNNAGSYWVVLTADNNDPNCQKKDSVLIIVKCTVTATFTSSATSTAVGGSLTFTSTTTGATSYQWYIDGIPQATTPNFTAPFPNAGGYNVYLVACNASCCDTSKFQLISVGTCNSKEANIWYFGYNAGWNFNTGSPVTLTNSAMRAEEAAATISDKNGQVLMYCDGQKIFNKNHQVMQNGNYLFGHNSSTMGALIVPMPGSNTIYYVFTGAAQCGDSSVFYAPFIKIGYPKGTMAYHIVDMAANAGLGSVITKNQILETFSTEKLVGIKHANGTDIWIVTHDTLDNFNVRLLTCTGFNTTPVVSKTGFIHSAPNDVSYTNTMGMMMISPNGRKIAVNTRISGTQLGDFNATTGVVSNMQTIDPVGMNVAQGLAFSPDSRKLYTTAIGPGAFNGLFQYNATLGSAAAITASITQLPTNPASVYTGLQLAPDGKIYLAELNGTSLHVINNPNAAGVACNLSMSSVPLGAGTTSRFALPNFLVDFMSPKKASKIQGLTVLCANSTFYIKNNCGLSTDSLAWILNGNSTIVSMVDSAITLSPGTAGTDTLISVQYSSCGVVTDTMIIQVSTGNLVSLGNDTTICGTINLTLNAGGGFANYLWSTTATTQTINVTTPGTYWVQVTSGACVSRDTIVITQATAMPNVNLGPNKIVCPGNVISLNAGTGYQTYTWQDNSTNQTFTAWLPGTYWVTVKDFCGNISSDTVTVLPDLSGSVTLGNDTVICNNQTIQLSTGGVYLNYLWSDSTTAQNLTANASGMYWIEVTDSSGCSYADTINVTLANGPSFSVGNDTATCDFTTFSIGVANNYTSYLWSTNATTPSINVLAAGTYWLQITDSVGCTKRDTIVISQSTNPLVNLGNDTIICNFSSYLLNAGNGFLSYSWSTSATTSSVNATSAGLYWVQVTDSAGCIARDSMTIQSVTSKPNVTLGNNSVLCSGQSVVLNAGAGYQSYTWQNSSTASSYTATTPGTYWVSVLDSCGNISKDTVVIQGDHASPVSLGPDKIICDDETTSLDAGNSYITYLWQDGSGNQLFSAVNSGLYYVQATSANGCIYSDSVTVTTIDCDTNYVCDLNNVPNAFSPNNDLMNDEYCLLGWDDCIKTFEIVIYDRWGEKMFQSSDPAFCWDGIYKGKIMDAQVFVYYINALSKKNEVIHKTGNISLIR